MTPGKFIISATPSARGCSRISRISSGPSDPSGDSKCDAGTHEDAITNTSSGSPSVARRYQRIPSTPATLASSCGSLTTAVVPRGTTARANCAGVSLADSRCTWASMNPGTSHFPRPSIRSPPVVGADPGDLAVGERDVAVEPLAGEGGEDLSALDDGVGLRVSAGYCDQALAHRPIMSSGRTGTRGSALPVAARSAATTAGVEEIVGGSPIPRSP